MQKIDSLLKHIIQPKIDDILVVVETIFTISGVQVEKKDIVILIRKDIKKIKLQVSGAKKTKLVLFKNELEKELYALGFNFVL